MENFIVIDSKQISDLNKPIFKTDENKEADIKKMLEENQKLFIDCISTGNIKKPIICGIEDIIKLREDIRRNNNLFKNFISPINRVEVIKDSTDDKYVSINNKLILNIAKKNNLKVLVYLL